MKRTAFVGQAMPRVKRNPHDWPTLNAWLYSIGVTDEHITNNFLYSALVDYFPGSHNGSHRVPTPQEIEKDRVRLVKTLKDFQPEIVVCVGRLSIYHCFANKLTKNWSLADVIGQAFRADPYDALGVELSIIPLPHPSGVSTWRHKEENKQLLSLALEILRRELA